MHLVSQKLMIVIGHSSKLKNGKHLPRIIKMVNIYPESLTHVISSKFKNGKHLPGVTYT